MPRAFTQQLATALYAASQGKSKSEIDAIASRGAAIMASKRLVKKSAALFAALDAVRLAAEKKVKAVITSKHTLSPSEVKAIAERMQHLLKKDIEVETVVDPTLLGGFKVRAGDMVYDATVDQSLKQLAHHLTTKE